jgi:prepilin-type N-terminal cleavage/methylation domain-containing protein
MSLNTKSNKLKLLFRRIKGFSIVELIVTVAIISMIMSVVMYNYSVFNDNLALSSAAQEVAIAIRQAQTYGLNVKEVTSSGGQFTSAYGIYFDKGTDTTNYYIFADNDADRVYDVGSGCGSGSTECVSKISFRNNVRISNICSSSTCPPSGAVMMDVTFLRPNPDSKIYFTDASGTIVSGPATQGKVTLISAKNRTVNVVIESTGQVSIQ